MSRLAENAQDLAVERQLIYTAWKSVRRIQVLGGTGRDADRPRSAALGGSGFGSRLIAHPRMGVRRNRNIDFDFAEKTSVGIEDLDPSITAIGNVNVSLCVRCDAVRCAELS